MSVFRGEKRSKAAFFSRLRRAEKGSVQGIYQGEIEYKRALKARPKKCSKLSVFRGENEFNFPFFSRLRRAEKGFVQGIYQGEIEYKCAPKARPKKMQQFERFRWGNAPKSHFFRACGGPKCEICKGNSPPQARKNWTSNSGRSPNPSKTPPSLRAKFPTRGGVRRELGLMSSDLPECHPRHFENHPGFLNVSRHFECYPSFLNVIRLS